MRRGRIVFGGSFNPVHTGHMRLARGAFDALAAHVDGLDFMPCARPAHKSSRNFLPFALRCRLLEAAIAALPWARVNCLEGRRVAPSYTWDSMRELRAEHPGGEIFFLLGSEDFAQLGAWRNGLRLDTLCSFLVAPRGNFGQHDFGALCRSLWPQACQGEKCADLATFCLPGGGRALFLPLAWHDVSSTEMRALWLSGGDLSGLLPAGALEIMRKNRRLISDCWQEKRDNAQGAPKGNA